MNIKGWTVAIVDDDPDSQSRLRYSLEDAELIPVIFSEELLDLDKVVSAIQGSAQAAICDHRLSHRGNARFYGAELVARCFERGFPAILVTQFQGPDQNVSIRKFRDKIPLVLGRGDAAPDVMKEGFEFCLREISGDIDSTRKGWRSLVRVEAVDFEAGEMVADVIIPGWDPNQAIRLPTVNMPKEVLALLPPDRKQNLGLHLFASVNIGALDSKEIYLKDFELAPALDDDDGLA